MAHGHVGKDVVHEVGRSLGHAGLQLLPLGRGLTMAEVALAWLLGKPGVVAPIVGASRPEHLEAAIRALDVELTAEENALLEAPYQPHAVRGHTS